MLAVAIDTASEIAGLALAEDGGLLAQLSWRTHRNHSRELLPALDLLLGRGGRGKEEIGAIFVCLGPGSYAGLRVGVSTAKAFAYGLGVDLVGVGRLAAEAETVALDGGPPVTAVQVAGRADLAWATYERRRAELHELTPPHLSGRDVFIAGLGAGAVVCGELDQALTDALRRVDALLAPQTAGRIEGVARLGWRRRERGEVDNADTLVPLYLREPAIGPQPPR